MVVRLCGEGRTHHHEHNDAVPDGGRPGERQEDDGWPLPVNEIVQRSGQRSGGQHGRQEDDNSFAYTLQRHRKMIRIERCPGEVTNERANSSPSYSKVDWPAASQIGQVSRRYAMSQNIHS